MEQRITSTGFTAEVDRFKNRIPDFDPRSGEHLWITIAAYKVDPEKSLSGGPTILDYENLLSVEGPGCYYCESEYNTLIASRRCKGHGDV
jgi:hypothetical protein